MRPSTILAAAALALVIAAPANAQGIGEALAVIDAADASGRVGKRTLAVGAQIFIGDVVSTDAAGEAQLLFIDGTRMVVGPNSSLVVDDLVFRGKASDNRFMVDARAGAYRFISGDSGDRNYLLRTPSATIGVQGTAFDYTVLQSGRTRLMSLLGQATMCGAPGDCLTTESQCEVLTAGAGQKVQRISAGSALARELLKDFPYQTSQDTLLDQFRVDEAGCDKAAGGVADFALEQSNLSNSLRTAALVGAGGLAAAVIACLVEGCDGGGGGGGSTIDTNNGTN